MTSGRRAQDATLAATGLAGVYTDPRHVLAYDDGEVRLQNALAAIGGSSELRTGTAYRRTTARGAAYQAQRELLYEALVAHLDTSLGSAGEYDMIFMDGDGTAAGYYNAHRTLKLAHRNIIEDPLFVPAHRSAWVQMADLVAWTAYQHLLRHPGKRFVWHWYGAYAPATPTAAR